MEKIILQKLEEIKRGRTPRTLDLFAGCGGISLGFKTAGFKMIGAVEIDPDAAASHAYNFFPGKEFEKHNHTVDITKTEPDELCAKLGLGEIENAVDVIIGGPPCQAFARVGRAKLREVEQNPQAFISDPRGNLYLQYLKYVRAFKPVCILVENVPDILNYGGHNIAEEICETLAEIGYHCHYTLVNAVHYGVPEMRQRMILVAFAESVLPENFFAKPTNYHELPIGYEGSKQVALQTISDSSKYYIDMSNVDPLLPPAVTAQEALSDLPAIMDHITGRMKRGARRFDTLIPYPEKDIRKINEYAKLMRTWPSYENYDGIIDHVTRYIPRDYDIFERMKPGDQYPEAYQVALDILQEKILQHNAENPNAPILEGTEEYCELFNSIVPPYSPDKFPNKWRKMEANAPARTLMAHLGKDGYSHIHYDSKQKRTISVREAARLQSFPDGFRFMGTMNPAFRQIGNAVPPLLSKAMAENMLKQIRRK